MPAKSVTYNSQNYAGTLGSGLLVTLFMESYSNCTALTGILQNCTMAKIAI